MPADFIDIATQSLAAANDSRLLISDGSSPLIEACRSWILKSPSLDTRSNYNRDLNQFIQFAGLANLDALPQVRPQHVAAWRDHLSARGLTNSSIRRKLTVLRSLLSYLQTYGYMGANPAHSDFVAAPAAPRDGKTLGLTPEDCRRFMDWPAATTPQGRRDRAMLAILAYTGCRVGELTRLKVGSYQQSGAHRVLYIIGKGGKERRVPLHPEAVERLESWLDVSSIRQDLDAALFPPARHSRDAGNSGFVAKAMTRRAVQALIKNCVRKLGVDPHVSVHSFRVTALTTARERGSDIIDLQDFAGHADPRTTLSYVRNRDRLSRSPAYVLKY